MLFYVVVSIYQVSVYQIKEENRMKAHQFSPVRQPRQNIGIGHPKNEYEFRIWYRDSYGELKPLICYGSSLQVLSNGRLLHKAELLHITETKLETEV